jgi:hypothetical protein
MVFASAGLLSLVTWQAIIAILNIIDFTTPMAQSL